MSKHENDPDILQVLDEADEEWTSLWRKVIEKKIPSFEIIYPEHLNESSPIEKHSDY